MDFHLRDESQALLFPVSIAWGIALLYILHQLALYLDLPLLSPPELLWNALIRLLPARLLLDGPRRQQLSASGMLSHAHAAKSEALRRAFGSAAGRGLALLHTLPTGDGLLPSASAPGAARRQPASDAPPGLGNWDNSCYQNSVLQGLAALDSLRPFLRFGRDEDDDGQAAESTGASLLRTVSELNSFANNGKKLWTPAKLKSMSSWQQQDAQEYFSKIMDELDKEGAKTLAGMRLDRGLEDVVSELAEKRLSHVEAGDDAARNAGARNPVEGFLAQRVACTSCGFSEGLSMIPFNCLTVPLSSSEFCNLEDCLDEYTKLEEISEVECAKCTLLKQERQLQDILEPTARPSQPNSQATVDAAMLSLPPELRAQVFQRLQNVREVLERDDLSDDALNVKCQIPKKGRVSSIKTRQAVVARPPNAFVVHINRSVFDEMTGAQRKNYARVRFPITLDLRRWMLNQVCSVEAKNAKQGSAVDASQSMLSSPGAADTQCLYRLKAVVTHYGRHENGHYICYRDHPVRQRDDPDDEIDVDAEDYEYATKPQWWRLSDEDVSPVSRDDVLAQGGAFMLFYEFDETIETAEPNGPAALTTPWGHTLSSESVREVPKADLDSVSESAESEQKEQPMELPPLATAHPTLSEQNILPHPSKQDPIPPTPAAALIHDSNPAIDAVQTRRTAAPPSQTPVMRTARGRQTSRSSLAEQKSGFGNSNFRPVAAT